MKRERITIGVSLPGDRRHYRIERIPFDMVDAGPTRECWVRYRGGRLFCRLDVAMDPSTGATIAFWRPFRFEPKKGNAYNV